MKKISVALVLSAVLSVFGCASSDKETRDVTTEFLIAELSSNIATLNSLTDALNEARRQLEQNR